MVKLLDLFYLCQAGAEKVYAVEARRLGEAGMIWSLADLDDTIHVWYMKVYIDNI